MDSIVLSGPGGASPVQIGSWLEQQKGADYGTQGLLKAIEAESFLDGGSFVYDRAGIRRMSFPLIVGSGAGLGLSLVQIESLLRLNARTGGYIDVQPEGVASSDAVRFDIVHGRWEPNYSIYHQRLPRRQGTLFLDTQPYGYWPTWITLASAASMMSPGRLPIKAASIIGDAPALARLVLMPDEQGPFPSIGVVGSWGADFLAWSIGGGSGLPTFLPGGSWVLSGPTAGNGTNLYYSDPMASQISGSPTVGRYVIGLGGDTFTQIGAYGLGMNAKGRHRLFGWIRYWGHPSMTGELDIMSSVDLVHASYNGPLASNAQVATLSAIGSWGGIGASFNASGIGLPYQLLDFGEVQIPNAVGADVSFPSYPMQLRLWTYLRNTSLASSRLDIAGMFLHPVDGAAGYVPRHLFQPSAGGGSIVQHGVAIDAYAKTVTFRQASAASVGIFDAVPGFPARQFYIGGMPLIPAGSDTNLNVVFDDRKIYSGLGATRPQFGRAAMTATKATLQYRPRFQFLRGL